jgi:hypothetical protein
MKAGDRISIDWSAFGEWNGVEEFVVEEFRHTLGIFRSSEARKAGRFTPMCDIYYDGPDSRQDYVSNYGEYRTNQVQGWSDIP